MDKKNIKVPQEKKLEKDILKEECLKCKEYLSGWQRCLADFENFRKEEILRIEKLRWQTKADLCLRIIAVLDNFQRMNACLPNELCENEWIKGVLMVEEQLVSSLKEAGLEEIRALGEKFNPEFHEAIEITEGEVEPETIIKVLEKGWLLDGKVLKPAKVKVIK